MGGRWLKEAVSRRRRRRYVFMVPPSLQIIDIINAYDGETKTHTADDSRTVVSGGAWGAGKG
jgi:hypothetical protein